MHSPSAYTDSLNDQDDLVYPCKGCGEILEEGKAFELAGNRWHIDCFRCNTCGTLLDSDANLLLLGDGSLICNNCTYSCNACGNKIEDLAILTGDQAFCASCFRCRNCKRKIENLRYARTSQGIFCMSCHESLMARRRKRAKGTPRQAPSGANGGPVEKALPSLPPGAASSSAFKPEGEAPPPDAFAGPPPERQNSQLRVQREVAPQHSVASESPLSDGPRKDANTLPASIYEDGRPSNVSDETDDGEERGFLPMTFDPNPIAPPSAVPRKQVPQRNDVSPPASENQRPRDYFGRTNSRSQRDPVRDILREDRPESSRSGSLDQDRDFGIRSNPAKVSPHIAYQEISRNAQKDASGASTPNGATSGVSPDPRSHERIKSQSQDGMMGSSEVSRHNSKGGVKSSAAMTPLDTSTKPTHKGAATSPESLDSPNSGVNPFDDPKRRDHSMFPTIPTASSRTSTDRPSRDESLSTLNLRTKSPESEISSIGTSPLPKHDRRASTSSVRSSLTDVAVGNARKSVDGPPPRAPGRIVPGAKPLPMGDYAASRAPPTTMGSISHRQHDSISTMQSSDGRISPAILSAASALPKHTHDEPFSMEEEMARILRGESRRDSQANESTGGGMLRRVSNAVKHGRSFSDRGLTSAGRIQATPESSTMDISAPISTSGTPATTGQAGLDQLRAQLRRASQRIAELEAEKSGLQDKVDSSAEITAASNELREKRNTMVVLDTQREMVVAELESMTAHLKKAKDSGKPLDLNALRTDISRDFADALQKVKDTFSRQIEDLIHKRNELTDEIGTLIQMKDKGFQEYESLSAKNAQLVEMNNQLVQNIQGVYKSSAHGKLNGAAGIVSATANGLGIHPVGLRNDMSTPNADENDAEAAALVSAPQVVNIRKGQPKKFNWRKGGEKMAKNVTKGIKGAFAGEKTPSTPYGDIGLPYNFTQVSSAGEPTMINGRLPASQQAAGFGIFGQKGTTPKTQPMGNLTKDGSSSNLVAAAEASVLFGSELEARCEHERRLIPSIISRCIEEVEARGMDVEGIYRKSGGSGQVKSVQQGFEKDGKFDVSDPDLDIHAVTSALKQYFRKLPTPLITYDVYESLLEAAQTQDKEKQVIALRASMSELPDAHRNCLEYLILHLGRVVQHESRNLMTPLNISVVFAPTIMRPRSIEREMSDMQTQRLAVQALLEHHQTIFSAED